MPFYMGIQTVDLRICSILRGTIPRQAIHMIIPPTTNKAPPIHPTKRAGPKLIHLGVRDPPSPPSPPPIIPPPPYPPSA
ncbi:hypothetical protein DPEC_G00342340 [Dallia pectoralis]|uniref:Uncharacterized protein n=1 Tax=Dallia pectoralis TaxID=75939 RepID=A0ACC2F5V2_DALPE|nr:hypothetical protein DPEC_G00342340 [Dallia pectoralis]